MIKLFDCINFNSLAASSTEKGKSEIRMEKLKLAMAWNKFDQVSTDLLNEKEENRWTVSLLRSFSLFFSEINLYKLGSSTR